MGFFKDFKDDFSQAMSELLPGEDFVEGETVQVNTLDNELDVEKELSKLDGLLEQVERKANHNSRVKEENVPVAEKVMSEKEPEPQVESEPEFVLPEDLAVESEIAEPAGFTATELETVEQSVETGAIEEADSLEIGTENIADPATGETIEALLETSIEEPEVEETGSVEMELDADFEETMKVVIAEETQSVQPKSELPQMTKVVEPAVKEISPEIVTPTVSAANTEMISSDITNQIINDAENAQMKEENIMDTMEMKETVDTVESVSGVTETVETSAQAENNGEITDEVSIITAGTRIKGNMETTGAFEIEGKVEGDVKCNGKLTVIGSITGNSTSSEFFADSAHIEGEITSTGTVKIGLGSVIVGNITATSAVIAGAVKGDIDVQGPVVVDTSAVIMGNIKSRSVQINNGAVIEGFCSQCYADVDVESLFGKKN